MHFGRFSKNSSCFPARLVIEHVFGSLEKLATDAEHLPRPKSPSAEA